ncbi:translocase inner membrane component YidC [Neoasaia chiangmaiensis NBRC 101099]|uniref:Membrane protein insertase YidC n=1 Tax=Neoasaia chiangmaiensis TaxID=320497 RepID=A0A1U9KR85_9PROT|nr:membrane protein insertase YidC [Neoasaia chiangmaiensis]AQS88364.1 membrane protein insertase YidC [Neoasaia chiangmaiensis]GBR39435.1 translocase inner membrane component YidC [Neoasaia chiangmaiensis NBRC 101099]GEN14578.1 membrane protein insertase YidC [Neoasaia chiangmaiensis]
MDIKRIITATVISALILIGFDYFVPQHSQQTVENQSKTQTSGTPPKQDEHNGPAPTPGASTPPANTADAAPAAAAVRLPIEGPDVTGSLDLRGARFDDLVLTHYGETLAKDSPLVRLLEKADGPQPSFVEIGWQNAPGSSARVPDASTDWTTDDKALSPDHPVTLRWDNGQGLLFSITMTVDRRYLFDIAQKVENKGGQAVSLVPYQRVERDYKPEETGGFIVHEGPLSVMNGRLNEDSYKNMRKGATQPGYQAWAAAGNGGWGGITDKYWLTAIVPDQAAPVAVHYSYVPNSGAGAYRVDFTSQAPLPVGAGATVATSSRIFAGAKEVNLLDQYTDALHIPYFYKAVDFGWFAFLTRPMFHVLHWLFSHLGNFGLALLALTLIIKLILYPLATKSFASMAKMRTLTPRIQSIRERHKDEPMVAQQQIMALYKEEGVNPAGGCLPLLIQAPVAFCLYKVLNITIEMRHAPFYGWIHDLSAADPTNIFTLFGLIPFDVTAISPMLHIGIWPILFGLTIFLMQRQTSVSMDPAQQRMMQFMPIIYVFFMGRLSAGIVIYYTWNNLLTFAQQSLIQRRANAAVPAQGGKKVVRKP